MSIASRLVTEVHNRNLHTFSENEARLMLGQNPDSEDFLINQSSDDILRYEIIKFMHNKQDSIADKHIQNYLQSLKREVKTNNLKLITGFAKKMKDKIMGREQ